MDLGQRLDNLIDRLNEKGSPEAKELAEIVRQFLANTDVAVQQLGYGLQGVEKRLNALESEKK